MAIGGKERYRTQMKAHRAHVRERVERVFLARKR